MKMYWKLRWQVKAKESNLRWWGALIEHSRQDKRRRGGGNLAAITCLPNHFPTFQSSINSFWEGHFFRGWMSSVNDNWSVALIELFSKPVALFYTEMISVEVFDKLLNSPVSPDIDLKVGWRSRRRSSPERGHNCISCTHWSLHCTIESCWVQWKLHAKGTQRWSINVNCVIVQASWSFFPDVKNNALRVWWNKVTRQWCLKWSLWWWKW